MGNVYHQKVICLVYICNFKAIVYSKTCIRGIKVNWNTIGEDLGQIARDELDYPLPVFLGFPVRDMLF